MVKYEYHLFRHRRSPKKLSTILTSSICTFLAALSLSVLTSTPVLAVDAVWLSEPGSGDWNTGANWSTSPTAPVNPGDTASFNTSTQTSLTLSENVTVESITFQPAASVFTISTNKNVLSMQGVGIVNNSGNVRIIFSLGGGSVTQFFKTSTAGNSTIIANGRTGGGSFFVDSSDGGTARAITNGNGTFNISGLTTAGMKIGSIEGSGDYFLGSKTLSVGGNNLSTTVSGVFRTAVYTAVPADR